MRFWGLKLGLVVLAGGAFQASVSGQSPQTATDSTTAPPPAASQSPVAAQLTPEQEGDMLMAQHRYQAAVAAYQQQTPPTAGLLNKMGIAYQLMFNLAGAQRCYQASLKLDPKNPRVLNNLGTVYDSIRNYGPAERMYKKALKLDPASALVLKNLGTNLLAQHKTQKGYRAYQAALKADPNIFSESVNPRIENPATVEARGAMNYYMARTCARAGQSERAIRYLRLALNEGYTTPKKIVSDLEFAPLRGIPSFEQLLQAQQQ
jgi:tetratricopeptide (TPR) repeat protein